MSNNPVYITLVVNGVHPRRDWAIGELDNPDAISQNLTSMVKDDAESQGINAEISVYSDPETMPSYQIIAVGPWHSDDELRDISDRVAGHALATYFESTLSGPSYFAEQLQVDGKGLSDGAVLIGGNTIPAVRGAAEMHIMDTIKAGDFNFESDRETMDASYIISDDKNNRIASYNFGLSQNSSGLMFSNQSESSGMDQQDDSETSMDAGI